MRTLMNILVVDNNAVWIETLKRGLKISGYDVIKAMSANEALMNLRDTNTPGIDLVLTDYFMAEMNGIELLKEIRKNFGSLPVIIMTAYNEKLLLIEAIRNHCNGFVEKSSTLDQLMQEINRVMNESQNGVCQNGIMHVTI
jgi:CheY-like chemotaxis protein